MYCKECDEFSTCIDDADRNNYDLDCSDCDLTPCIGCTTRCFEGSSDSI